MILETDYGTQPGPAWVEAARRHAVEEHPREAVGAVLPDGSYQRLANVSRAPERAWRLSPTDLSWAVQTAIALIHSHPVPVVDHVPFGLEPDCPSLTDQQGQLEAGIAYGVVLADREKTRGPFLWGPGVQRPGYVGRRWRHRVTDCYEITRDKLREAGLHIPDIPRAFTSDARLLLDTAKTVPVRRIGLRELAPNDILMFRHSAASLPDCVAPYLGNSELLLQEHHGWSRIVPVGPWLERGTFFGALRWEGS